MRLVAYQTDIPQNLGALMRVAACFDAPLDVIGPCGFPFSGRDVKRVAMDYADLVDVTVHISWPAFPITFTKKLMRGSASPWQTARGL